MRINELADSIADRIAEVKALMEILSESSDSALSDILLQRTGRMYRRLSDLHEELIKSEKTENK
ncbi:MAG: hypothetical protein ACI4KB_11975 [Oscillospiraceae bacterium]|nr:hypothetical protein [Oscillospiraceae bacterium]